MRRGEEGLDYELWVRTEEGLDYELWVSRGGVRPAIKEGLDSPNPNTSKEICMIEDS